MIINKQEKLQILKKETGEYFCEKLKDLEIEVPSKEDTIEDIAKEMNEAFWEDVFLEVNYEKFLAELKVCLDRKKVLENEVVDSTKWEKFFGENEEYFRHYRGIEVYNVEKIDARERYSNVRKWIDKSIWDKAYPCFLLRMHDFKLKKIEKEFWDKVKNFYLKEDRKLNRLSLLVCNNVESGKYFSLEKTLEKEIESLLKGVEKEEIVEKEKNVLGKYLEELLEEFGKEYIEENFEEIFSDIEDSEKMEVILNKLDEKIEESKYGNGIKNNLLNERLNYMKECLRIVAANGRSKKLKQKRISCNTAVFFRILNYKEEVLYDKGLVLKMCNDMTGWIDFYLYIQNKDIVQWQYEGIALNYYLRTKKFEGIETWIHMFRGLNQKFWEMKNEMKLLGINPKKYVQIEKLLSELMRLNDDEWGTIKDKIDFLISEL